MAYARERGLPVRRACTLFSVARSALSYRSRKTVQDKAAIERMKQLSGQYPRYGYRRIHVFLSADGQRMSPGRAYRLWRLAGLQVPRNKRVAASRPRPLEPTAAGPGGRFGERPDHFRTVSSDQRAADSVDDGKSSIFVGGCASADV